MNDIDYYSSLVISMTESTNQGIISSQQKFAVLESYLIMMSQGTKNKAIFKLFVEITLVIGRVST